MLEVADYIKAGNGSVRINTDDLANRMRKRNVTATAINGLEGVGVTACERLAHERGVGFRCGELDKVG